MGTKNHGIKIGDLVKFKHHMFDGLMPVHLVTEVCASDVKVSCEPNAEVAVNIRLHGKSGITHRASAFVLVKRA